MKQRIVISRHFKSELAKTLSETEHDSIFVLTDGNTYKLCWPIIAKFFTLRHAHVITIPSGDNHKTLEYLTKVWLALDENNATRHSCMINLGGGMITDLGGFAASTFKRGIDFVNVPTTLLAMVDASVGGKTGINFNGLKNEIGVFNESKFVILDTSWLKTLDNANIRSGYAEMLKHSLLSNEKMWAQHISFDLATPDLNQLSDMVKESVAVKERIVNSDPLEHGMRKALNLGHTVGHAFESFSFRKNNGKGLLHGYAVAFGLVCELYLSAIKTGFPTDKMHQTVSFIRDNYGTFDITCDDYAELIRLMHHDKKNVGQHINFTLLSDVGGIQVNQTATEEEIKEALDFFREG